MDRSDRYQHGPREEADDAISEHGTAEIARRLGGGPDPHPMTIEIGTLEAIAEDEERKAGAYAREAAMLTGVESSLDLEDIAEQRAIALARAKACRAGAEALRKEPT